MIAATIATSGEIFGKSSGKNPNVQTGFPPVNKSENKNGEKKIIVFS